MMAEWLEKYKSDRRGEKECYACGLKDHVVKHCPIAKFTGCYRFGSLISSETAPRNTLSAAYAEADTYHESVHTRRKLMEQEPVDSEVLSCVELPMALKSTLQILRCVRNVVK
jgi:hypothetical protein